MVKLDTFENFLSHLLTPLCLLVTALQNSFRLWHAFEQNSGKTGRSR